MLGLLLGVLALPGEANADGGPLGSGCYACGLWLPVGVNIGAGPRWQDGKARSDLLLGGEVSLIDLRRGPEGFNLGVYADGLYDLRAHRTRVTLGPETVFTSKKFFLGLDAGAALEWGGGQTAWGGRARLFLPLVLVTPYVGYTRLFAKGDPSIVEMGVLLKLPLPLSD